MTDRDGTTGEHNRAAGDAERQLAHAARLTSLGQLTASIAHEVNQPLGGILSNGQAGLRWLQRAAPDVNAAIYSLENVVSEARRASAVIARFRALARNDAPVAESVDLASLLAETLLLLAHELRRNRIEVIQKLEADLPPARGDLVQLQQVAINLVMNAIEAMEPQPDDARTLTITTTRSDDLAIVSVADSGPGLAEGVRERLFAAFTTNKPNGLGLGLSICSAIVARHGGAIWLERGGRTGAEFRFSVPLQLDAAGA